MSSPRSSGAFITYRGKYLLMLRDDFPHIKNPNTWSILGGITEEAETPEESLIRELKEEGNIDVVNYQLLFNYPTGETVFHIELNEDQFKQLKLGDEGQDLQFFTFEELIGLSLSSTVQEYLKDYGSLVKSLVIT
ncbi:MAG: NUDIX domain-containing protein [bacterium]|nr:NUDIX domain-containing protein [bacterium]